MIRRCVCLIGLVGVLTGITGIAIHAQDDDDANSRLILFNYDSERPTLFQSLAQDDAPDPFAFVSRLTVLSGDDLANAELPESIYIAIENTAWSEGAIGLSGAALARPDDYVALEVWVRMGNMVLRDDGQGLMFPLEYVSDLTRDQNDEAVPGFRLDVLIMQHRTFRLYRVDEDGGLPVWGKIHVREGLFVDAPFVSFQVDPTPVLGDLLLDLHIIALPEPSTPEPTPVGPSLTETPVF